MTRQTTKHPESKRNRRGGAILAILALGLAWPAGPVSGQAGPGVASASALPAVARPRFAVSGRETGAGTAFFLRVPGSVGAVAVAAAHSFDFAELARSDVVTFRLGASGRRVAASSGFHSAPGLPFSAPGATLRDDFVIFALDAPPYGVRLMEAAERSPKRGTRVQLLGVPAMVARDEDDIFGRVAAVGDTRIEVELDVPVDLRGWGGAPVIDPESGRVVGLLEAVWPDGNGLRLGVAPITGVRAALASPLDGGRGAPFSRYASHAAGFGPRRAAATKGQTSSGRSYDRPAPDQPLLGRAGAVESKLHLEIEYPEPGAVLGDDQGVFIAGRAIALLGEFRRFDVVLVIDTSGSANQMSGADINGNGVIGQDRLGGLLGGTDSADSILAAEVAAAREVLRGLDPRNTRVGLVTFSGETTRAGGNIFSRRRAPPAITEEVLTTDYAAIEEALNRVLARGAHGLTHMAAGVDQATVELLGLRGARSEPDKESEKVVLFFTDGQPTLPYDAIFEADNVKAVLRAADRAGRAQITIHSFAIGPEALEGPIATVEMAERTDGYFTPVRHPGDLLAVIENVNFANVEELSVRNLRNGAPGDPLVKNADGSWSALVRLEPGKNRIEVTARATNGAVATERLTVQHAPGAPAPSLPRPLMAQRNRLLEQRLLDLKRARLETQREAAEQTRRELVIEIEAERDAARARAQKQRKELELEAEAR